MSAVYCTMYPGRTSPIRYGKKSESRIFTQPWEVARAATHMFAEVRRLGSTHFRRDGGTHIGEELATVGSRDEMRIALAYAQVWPRPKPCLALPRVCDKKMWKRCLNAPDVERFDVARWSRHA